MNLTSKNIKKIHQISKNPVCGFFLFLIFSVYNFYGSFILQLHKFTRPTIIDPTAQIHPSASISHWGVHVKKNVIIGENTVIKPHTTIYSGTTIHDRCVIGDTGYQIYRYRKKRLPIIHTGHVIISNDVEIRNNTCIDRAVFGKTTIINSYTRIGMNVKVGHNIRIGSYCLIDDDAAIGGNCTIGDHVSLGTNVIIEGNSTLGDHVNLQSLVYIPTNTVLGSHVFIGPNSVLTNDKYPPNGGADLHGPILEDYVSIGANATILPGVIIGIGSLVAAGSVVTKDVPPGTLAIGSPARMKTLPVGAKRK